MSLEFSLGHVDEEGDKARGEQVCTGLSLYLWPPGFWVWLRNIIDHPHLPKGGKAPRPMTAAVRIQRARCALWGPRPFHTSPH